MKKNYLNSKLSLRSKVNRFIRRNRYDIEVQIGCFIGIMACLIMLLVYAK